MRSVVTLLVLLLASSCAVLLGIDEGTERQDDTPLGGGSAEGGGGIGGFGGGTGGSGGEQPTQCGSINMLTDSFDAPFIDPVVWNVFSLFGAPVVMDDALVMETTPGEADFIQLQSVHGYNVMGGTFEVHFAALELQADGAAEIGLEDHDGTEFGFFSITPTTIQAQGRLATFSPQPHPANLSAVRIRQSGDDILWETFDGTTWSLFESMPVATAFPTSIAAGVIRLYSNSAATASTISVSGVAEQPGDYVWCSSDDLTDTFDDDVVSPLWGRHAFGMSCSWSESGPLTLSAGDPTELCAYASAMDYELAETGLSVRVSPAIIPVGGFITLTLFLNASDFVEARLNPTTVDLVTGGTTPDTVVDTASYDRTNPIWLKLRPLAGDVLLERSLDGATFTEVGRVFVSQGVEEVQVLLRANGGTNPATNTTVSFDEFNPAP